MTSAREVQRADFARLLALKPRALEVACRVMVANEARQLPKDPVKLQAPWSDLADAASNVGAARRWRVEGAIEGEPLIILAGPEKRSKSWAAIDLSIAVAAEGHWLDRFRVRQPGRVLYLDAEYGEHEFARRVLRLARGSKRNARLAMRRIKHLYSSGLVLDDSDEKFKAVCGDAKRLEPALIVVDPFRNHLDGDENSARDVIKAFRAVDVLRRVARCPVLVIHHLNKSGGYSGSRAFMGRADLILEGSDADTPVFAARGRTVRRDDPIGVPFSIELEHTDDHNDAIAATRARYVPRADVLKKPETLRDKILDLLSRAAPEGRSTNYLCKAIRPERSPAHVDAEIEKLVAEGVVANVPVTVNGRTFGGWALVDGAPDSAPDSHPTR